MKTKIPTMQELLEAGAHFGHKLSRGNPRMKRYIFGAREGVHIVDLAETERLLTEAAEAAYEFGKSGKVMLLVGTKKQAQEIIKQLATEAGTYFMVSRWMGGLFTNFEEMRKNIKKLMDLKTEQDKGELTRYTKREQLLISKKLIKFENEMGGVKVMDKLPEAIFVVDAVSDNTAVKEALRQGIKIFGICDTNADPNWFDYPVPANDDGIKSIKMICETVIKAYTEGKKDAGIAREAKAVEDAKEAQKQSQKKEELAGQVAEETAVLEEEIERVVVGESSRKVE